LHSLPVVTTGLLLWTPEEGPEVARAYRDFMTSAPAEVGGGLFYITGPAEEFVPAHLVDQLTCAVVVAYAGPETEARRAMAAMFALRPDGEFIVEVPYAEMQCLFDDPPGYRNYWSVEYLDQFPDEAIDRFCARAADMIVPSPSQHVLFPQGGAIASDATDYPIPWRRARWCVHPFGLWDDPADDERAKRWARDICSDLRPWASGAVAHNFIGDEGQERVIAGFGRENYDRLAKIKARYDPDNIFHLNHNVKPSGTGANGLQPDDTPDPADLPHVAAPGRR
jgi:hypothetical protein